MTDQEHLISKKRETSWENQGTPRGHSKPRTVRATRRGIQYPLPSQIHGSQHRTGRNNKLLKYQWVPEAGYQHNRHSRSTTTMSIPRRINSSKRRPPTKAAIQLNQEGLCPGDGTGRASNVSGAKQKCASKAMAAGHL